jgi:hypothetical protein
VQAQPGLHLGPWCAVLAGRRVEWATRLRLAWRPGPASTSPGALAPMIASCCWPLDKALSNSPARPASWGNTCQPASRPLGRWSGCAPVNVGMNVVRSPATVKMALMWCPVSIQAQLVSSGEPNTVA